MKGRLDGPPHAAESGEGEAFKQKEAGGACAVVVPDDPHREVREILSAPRRLCPKGHDTL